jgi:hypothetical protein
MNERYFVKSMSRLKLSPQGNPRYKFVVVTLKYCTQVLMRVGCTLSHMAGKTV